MTNVNTLTVGDTVRQDAAFNRSVPYLTFGTVLAVHPERIGPGNVTVRWDNGRTLEASGYHIRKMARPRPPLDVTDPDNVRSHLEA